MATLVAGLCALVLPVAPAFGEGSLEFNQGPDDAVRHALDSPQARIVHVYARAGETIQLASSAMASGAGNILLFAPGADPASATPVWNCDVNDPGTGWIGSRDAEEAGPEPSPDPDAYAACEFSVPAGGDGIYSVRFVPPDPGGPNNGGGEVGAPVVGIGQGSNISAWDITVRDAGGARAPGRAFWNINYFRTSAGSGSNTLPDRASDVRAFVYTKTGYEYQVNLFDHGGVNWALAADDQGVIDRATGNRVRASVPYTAPADAPLLLTNDLGADDFRHPQFYNRIDPVVITGPGGLAATRGFSDVPISPASNPLSGAAFAGSAGQAGATNRGSGGTIRFTSPTQMEGLGYTIAIDTDRNGTFGGGSDFVDASGDLSGTGSNSLAWNGRDGAGNVPACGDYQYQVRSTLSEVHFTQNDVENSAGIRIERLSLAGDPALGNVFSASYNDINPYPPGGQVANSPIAVRTDADSSATGFHSWTNNSGDRTYLDTWTRLPEVAATGTLRLLCADPQVVKSADPSRAVPGEDVTFRLEVKNNGPDAATNVVATDDLPDTVTFRSASQGCAEAGGVVTCTLASLAAGATHTFEIVVAVPSDIDECLENTGTVTNSTPDTSSGNNESSVCVPVLPRADLSISKDPSRTRVGAGGQVMFTLVVENDGPSDSRGVEVLDPLAPGLTLVAADPSQGTCTTANNTLNCDLGGLKDGGSAQVLVTAQLSGTACVTNTARVRSANEDPNAENNQDSAQVCPTPTPDPRFDLAVTKRANDRSLFIGQRVTYRVVVTNNGPAAAPDVRLTDTLNAPVRVVRVRTTAGSCERRIPMRCELGTIAAGERVTIRIVAKHRESGCRQRQAASATGNGTDANPADNLDTVDVCVRKVRLKLSKVASVSTVRAGETFSYRIRVRNPTKGEARRVKVCDRLPNGLRYVSSKPRAKRQGGRRCWTIKRLGARKSRTFRVTVRAARGANGRKTNRATVTSPDSRRVRDRDVVRVRGVATPVTG